MDAVVFLTPTHAEIVRRGYLVEPGWRPFPGTPADGGDDEDVERALKARDRRAAERPLEQDEPAAYWKRSAFHVAALVTGGMGDGSLLGFANVAGAGRHSVRGVRKIKVGPWINLRRRLPLSEIARGLPSRSERLFVEIVQDRNSRPLPPGLARDVVVRLSELLGEEFERLGDLPPHGRAPRRPSGELLRADTNQSALRFFSRGWRSLEPAGVSQASQFALAIEQTVPANEDEAITDDASRFLDWMPMPGTTAGWFEFRDGERRLLTKNINFKPEETQTGADLVYVSRDPDCVVLVQYKVMEMMKMLNEPYLRDTDGRLALQVDRMLRLSGDLVDRTSDEAVARIGGDFGFVKFLLPPPTTPRPRDELVDGRYLPADAVRRMLSHPDTGPQGGAVHYVHRRRHIDGEVFARLVRDRWIGSRREATTLLLEILGLAPSGTAFTLAVEEPLR